VTDVAVRDELVEIMSRLADGDETAAFSLYEVFGDRIAGTVRSVLRERGLVLVRDDVDGLVLEACFAIGAVARAWSPDGGALPWVYARRRIENCVDRVVGQRTVPLDDTLVASLEAVPAMASPSGWAQAPSRAPASTGIGTGTLAGAGVGGGAVGRASERVGVDGRARAGGDGRSDGGVRAAGRAGASGDGRAAHGRRAGDGGPGGAGDEAVLSEAFARLAAVDERCRLLSDALDRAAVSATDREMCFQYAVERGRGNRSPATTVGAVFDLADATVRQRVHRSKRRLRAVAAADDRFAPLADLPLLA
jgi:hypothetical protein